MRMRLRQLLNYCDYWLLPNDQELLVSNADSDHTETHGEAAAAYISKVLLGSDTPLILVGDADRTQRALVHKFGASWRTRCESLLSDKCNDEQKLAVMQQLDRPQNGVMTAVMIVRFGWIRIAEDSIELAAMRRDCLARIYRWLATKARAKSIDEDTLDAMPISLSSPRMDCRVRMRTLRRANVRLGDTRRDFARPAQLAKEEDNMRNPTYRGKPDGD